MFSAGLRMFDKNKTYAALGCDEVIRSTLEHQLLTLGFVALHNYNKLTTEMKMENLNLSVCDRHQSK